MRWITKSHLHLDRVATPWLVARFVDPHAEFAFVDWDQPEVNGDGIPFGITGVELSSHDEHGTCFRKVLVRYQLTDPALLQMERIIASGVADALGSDPPVAQTETEVVLGAALNRIGTGMGLVFSDDEHLRAGMSLYEAVFALCQVMALAPDVASRAPTKLPDRIAYLRQAIDRADPDPGVDGQL